MFSKVLVANRGEIDLGIIRAGHDLDIEAVAVTAAGPVDYVNAGTIEFLGSL